LLLHFAIRYYGWKIPLWSKGVTPMKTPAALVAAFLFLLTLCSWSPLSAQGLPVDAIGRLTTDEIRCTGFVVHSQKHQVEQMGSYRGGGALVDVYENWIVTAGHCAGANMVFHLGHRGGDYPVRVVGFSGPRFISGHDVLVGRFSSDWAIPTLEPAFGYQPQAGEPLMLIGYGFGALMARVGAFEGLNEFGQLTIHSYGSPGNSGGPVLIPGTRRVVGIGVETTTAAPPGVSPVYCRFVGCAIKPPYFATPIDRIRDLVRWPD
jgi:trypsin-like peptidase